MAMGKKAERRRATHTDAGERDHQPCLGDVAGNAELRMRADTRLSTAWAVFIDRDLPSVTVVDDAGHPVGTLLRRELAEAVLDDAPTVPGVVLEDLTPPAETARQSAAGARTESWTRGWRNEEAIVEEIMRAAVNTLPAAASLADAAAVLEVAELSEVIVVDERGLMVGLVAAEDLVPYLPPGPPGGRGRPRQGSGGRAAARR
jgi:CBS domain-containing protein